MMQVVTKDVDKLDCNGSFITDESSNMRIASNYNSKATKKNHY